MYRRHLSHPEFESFYLPFGGHLASNNRWVRMAKLIPWTEVEQRYEKLFADSGMGAPAKNVRIALGALIIKERLGLSDEETVEQIRENPYLQYFLGYQGYQKEAPFEASMMVHFRKRLGREDLNWVQERIAQRSQNKQDKPKDKDPPQNDGKLIVDATVAPADIKYPTDVNLLNEAREKTEAIIDRLHEPLRGQEVKVRTYRQRARKDYLRFAKKRKHTQREWRQAIGKQLRYVQRNVRHIQQLANRVELSRLSRRQLRDLWVVQELLRQQQQMHREGTHAVAGRIVSLGVAPISWTCLH
jgi:transposase, IS5 family